LARHVDHALTSPESLQHFDTIIVLGANGTIIIAADASFMPERRAEARRLNDGRDTMGIEAGGKTVRKAATKEKAGRAKQKPFKDKPRKRNT
jgi:hypothetical protein